MGEYVVRYKASGKKRTQSSLLASFANGHLKPELSDELKFEVYSKQSENATDSTLKKRSILVANSSRICYTGPRDAEGRKKLCNYYVCVVNKRKRKMKVYDTDLYHCKPLLEIKDTVAVISQKSFTEKMDDLTSSFGSKAKKRAMKSRAKYQVDKESMVQSLSAAADESLANSNESELVSNEPGTRSKDSGSSVLPPINKDASEVEDVFDIHDVIPHHEFLEIEPKALELAKAENSDILTWKASGTYGKLVLNYLENHRDEISLDKAKLLAYYNYLAKFYKLTARELNRKDPCPEIPEPFKTSFVERFAVKSIVPGNKVMKLSLSPGMKDKLLSHAFILGLFVFDFLFDLSILQSDFRCGAMKVTKLAHALGCYIVYKQVNKSGDKSRFAELKLPLFTPKENTRYRKK